jgi:hypothetical protein
MPAEIPFDNNVDKFRIAVILEVRQAKAGRKQSGESCDDR